MIPGLNHNIRYRDRVFHVQTEDSGLIRRQLTTHVFLEGSVIAHERTTYAEALASLADETLRNAEIRKLMQGQHRTLLRRLVDGAYDEVLVRLGVIQPSRAPSRVPAPPPPAPPPLPRPSAPPPLPQRTSGLPPPPRLSTLPPPPALGSHPPSVRPSHLPPPPPLSMPPLPRAMDRAHPETRARPPHPAAHPPQDPRSVPRPDPTARLEFAQTIRDLPVEQARATMEAARAPRTRVDPPRPPEESATTPEASRPSGLSKPAARPLRPPPSDPALRPAPPPSSSPQRPPPVAPSRDRAAAERYGRTLVDAPPLLPPELAASVRRTSAPPPPEVPTVRGPRPVITDRPADPPRGTPEPPIDLENDTLLDMESPFLQPPPAVPRPRSGSSSLIADLDRFEAGQRPPPRPSVPTASPPPLDRSTVPTLREGSATSRKPPRPPERPRQAMLEDPTMDPGFLPGPPPVDEEVLDVLDVADVISELDDDTLDQETDPGRSLPPWRAHARKGAARREAPPVSADRLAPYPTPSSPPLAGAAWLDAGELGGPPAASARGEPGPRPWAEEGRPPREPSRTRGVSRGAPPPTFGSGTTPPPDTDSGVWRTPEGSSPPPAARAWPSTDTDLDQLSPLDPAPMSLPPDTQKPTREPRGRSTAGSPIRADERSLDDIILGYLTHKKKP